MKDINVEPLNNICVDRFIADNNLFALFDSMPANIVFTDNFIDNINKFKDVFTHYSMQKNIFFSCKANKSYAFLYEAAQNDCGIEVSSYFELVDALKFTKKIIASGPGKDKDYLSLAIKNNVIISVDDINELKQIISYNNGTNVMLRISNLQDIISRFGINISQIDKCLSMIKGTKVNLIGFSFHINNYDLDIRIKAIKQLIDIIKNKNLKIKYIDIGGGLPVNYCTKEAYNNFMTNKSKKDFFKGKIFEEFYPYYNEIANEKALEYILENVKKNLNGIELIIEPGRSLLNNCGISIFEVQYVKKVSNGDNLIVTNGNINCLSEQWFNTDYIIAPKLYCKKVKHKKETFLASVVGNLCLEQDIITWKKIQFDIIPERGDLLIYYNTAGYQMDSNESTFHKIPLVEKYVVTKEGTKFKVKGDKSYDCK